MGSRTPSSPSSNAAVSLLAAPDRCSFDMHTRFSAFSEELSASLSASQPRLLSPTTRVSPCSPALRSPRFVTLPRSEGKLDRQTAAARLNAGNVRTPYREPTAHQFREATPERWREGRDFVAKFTLPSRQDRRRHVALNQEGFFGPAPGEDIPAVSSTFKQQIQQQQQRLYQQQSPTKGSRGSIDPLGFDPPRSPDAFQLPFRVTPHPVEWPPNSSRGSHIAH